jgi:DNA-binding NarL/FixJ family response regulator
VLKVLIVDDSAIVRDRLREALSDVGGVEIAGEAADAVEGVRLAREIAPRLVILDIHMPGGSGIDVLHRIKEHAPGTIVVMFTNFSGEQYRKTCMSAGADYFCDKSMEYETVARICRDLQEQRAGGHGEHEDTTG